MSYFTETDEKAVSPNEVRKRKRKAILAWTTENASIIIIIVLLLIASGVLFISDIKASGQIKLVDFAISTAAIATVSYLLFFNGFATGGRVAKDGEFGKKIDSLYDEQVKIIREKKIEWRLEPFCAQYVADELKRARYNIMIAVGLTYEDFEKLQKGETLNLTEEQREAFEKARALKPITLNRQMIMSPSGKEDRREPIRSNKEIVARKIYAFGTKFVSVVICSAFTMYGTFEVIFNFTPATLCRALVQLGFLIWSIMSGLMNGYSTQVAVIERKEDITKVIYEFFEWESK